MSLAERLDAIGEEAKKRVPEEKRAVMARTVEVLRASGIMDGVARVGSRLPELRLTNPRDEEVGSSDLLSRGAVVLTVFRGSW